MIKEYTNKYMCNTDLRETFIMQPKNMVSCGSQFAWVQHAVPCMGQHMSTLNTLSIIVAFLCKK